MKLFTTIVIILFAIVVLIIVNNYSFKKPTIDSQNKTNAASEKKLNSPNPELTKRQKIKAGPSSLSTPQKLIASISNRDNEIEKLINELKSDDLELSQKAAESLFKYGFYAYYDQNTNKLYVRDNAGTTWLGGYAPGSSNVIENSYAKLNCAATTVQGSGNTMTVTWSVALKSTFTGTKNTYLYVRDDSNAYAGWTWVGKIT